MTIKTFIKGLALALAFGAFIFSGGCAFTFYLPCILKPRCDGLHFLFVIPGVLAAFVSATFFLLGLRTTRLPRIIKIGVGVILSSLMGGVLYILSCYLVKSYAMESDVPPEAYLMVGGYLGILLLSAFFTVRMTIKTIRTK